MFYLFFTDSLRWAHCYSLLLWSLTLECAQEAGRKEDSACGLATWKCANRMAFTGHFPHSSLQIVAAVWNSIIWILLRCIIDKGSPKSLKLFQFPSKISFELPSPKKWLSQAERMKSTRDAEHGSMYAPLLHELWLILPAPSLWMRVPAPMRVYYFRIKLFLHIPSPVPVKSLSGSPTHVTHYCK